MGRSNYTPRSAEENARRSLEAAQKNEAFKAMPQVEAERIEARTMQRRALRLAKEGREPNH